MTLLNDIVVSETDQFKIDAIIENCIVELENFTKDDQYIIEDGVGYLAKRSKELEDCQIQFIKDFKSLKNDSNSN